MADYDINELTDDITREIATRPLTKPDAGEYVAECCWSRTGWAVYLADGACTCRPAEPPACGGESAPQKQEG